MSGRTAPCGPWTATNSGALAVGARLLVLNTPHNPTGKVFSADEMRLIADVAISHDFVVITDEIYEHLVFDGARHLSLAVLDGMRERTIVVNSISKMANATGWRVGWVVSPPAWTPRIRALHDTLVIQAPTPLQKAAVTLLNLDATFFEGIRERCTAKRAVLHQALEAAGFRMTAPRGAYYLFADYRGVPALRGRDPMAAALYLIEVVGVAAVPGDNFYAVADDGGRYLRFAFCRSLETLEQAARRLSRLGEARPRTWTVTLTTDAGTLEPGPDHSIYSGAVRYGLRCHSRNVQMRFHESRCCGVSTRW